MRGSSWTAGGPILTHVRRLTTYATHHLYRPVAVAGVAEQTYAMCSVAALSTHPANPRTGDVEAIRASIVSNDFYGAVVAQKATGYVLAGNHRLLAARQVGLDELPVIWVDVDDSTARRILAVDNRTNDLAAYDDGALVALLQAAALDGDLVGTGYAVEDLEGLAALLAPLDQTKSDEEVLAETDEDGWPVIRAKVPPDIHAEWCTLEGEDDTERLIRLLRAARPEPAQAGA